MELHDQATVYEILLVEDDNFQARLITRTLTKMGYSVTRAGDGEEALAKLETFTPDLVISDIMMPNMDGHTFLKHVRADLEMSALPFIFLTAQDEDREKVAGLDLGADDYLTKPVNADELGARVRGKLARPPVPRELLRHDLKTGLLNEGAFLDEVDREFERYLRGGSPGILARLDIFELPQVVQLFGPQARTPLIRQIATVVERHIRPLEVIGHQESGALGLLLPEENPESARRRMNLLAQDISREEYSVGSESLRLTPVIGFAAFGSAESVFQLHERVNTASYHSEIQLDLEPALYEPSMQAPDQPPRPALHTRILARTRSYLTAAQRLTQFAVIGFLAFVVPFIAYVVAGIYGFNLAFYAYIAVVTALLITALLIWIEGFVALSIDDPPEAPDQPFPTASAIIAAYLPNEAPTIISTLESFLQVNYPGALDVILAYNTPRDLPIERELQALSRRDPRLRVIRVPQSTSKAQNVNAALSEIKGEFVGIFDADHHPSPDAFTRAWRWLSNGYDVVQGHCLVRNGDDTWVSRMVAVEFESIYAVSHPGRAKLHGFGLFGGSNGYWKTSLLSQTRMHGFMLTEDIDASIRVIEEGYKIASDRKLVSRELAPLSLDSLWKQRMRWAQGWFQVSMKHFWRGLRSEHLSPRQKMGLSFLLGWREIYPWISVQVFPIIAYWIWKLGSVAELDWLVPVFVFTTIFTLGTGPGQTFFAYKLADPSIRKHKGWFISHLILASVFYTPYKNLIAVTAQIREFSGERVWRVTPRVEGKSDS